jgi:hypothetical protein
LGAGSRRDRARTLPPSSFCTYSITVFTPFASGPIVCEGWTRAGEARG